MAGGDALIAQGGGIGQVLGEEGGIETLALVGGEEANGVNK